MSAIRPRSMSPSRPKTPSPKRSRTALCTSSSERSSSWTISSLEITAAPWRSKARNISDLPAPIPPVTATATGRDLGGLFFLRRSRLAALGVARALLLGRNLVGFDTLVGQVRSRLAGELRCGLGFGAVRENFLGKPECRRVPVSATLVPVDPLERERKATTLRIHLDDLRLDRV